MRINLSHTEINIWNYENNRHQNIKHSKKSPCRTLTSVLHYRFLHILIRTMTHRVCDEEINKVVHPAHVSVQMSSVVRVLFFKNSTEPGKQKKVFSLTGLFWHCDILLTAPATHFQEIHLLTMSTLSCVLECLCMPVCLQDTGFGG